jgi:lipoate---protein ligase
VAPITLSEPCVDSPVRITTAAEEQAWNIEQLALPVSEPSYRVWTYERGALVLGHLRAAASEVPRRTTQELVRRQSGGGAVLVGPWLVGASVVLPWQHPLAARGVVDSYRWLGEAHAGVLRGFGINASAICPPEIRTRRANESLDLQWACFGSLSPWEVVGNAGRKLVGLAQVRRRTGMLLVAGTLVSTPDWRLLTELMDQPPALADRLADCTTNCELELGRPVFAADFASSLSEEIGRRLNEGPHSIDDN